MSDLKRITVEYLRGLARKLLGRGQSGLPGGKEVLEQLVRHLPGLAPLVERLSSPEPPDEPPAPKPAPRPLPGNDEEKTPVYTPPRPAKVVTFPPKPKPSRSTDDEPTIVPGLPPPKRSEAPTSASSESSESVASPAPPSSAETLVEGFFVARIAGEDELRRHHLAEKRRSPGETLVAADPLQAPGELPRAYADDTVLLLARDPYTLYVFWDFSAATLRQALDGLEAPHAVLRVYEDGDVLVRVVDIALESRGHYLHGMVCGRPYRVEVHFVGREGRSRRVGRSSNRVFLPPVGPSSDTWVRFLRIPPLGTARRGAGLAAAAQARTEDSTGRDYITWRRVALPVSGAAPLSVEPPREQVGPGAPSGRPGEVAPARTYLQVRRAEGSSEQVLVPGAQPVIASNAEVASRGPAGSSEQWVWSHGPAGSSLSWEEWRGPTAAVAPWVGSHGPSSSSEHWVWSHGPAGASEAQAPGLRPPGPSSEQWVWTHGPADAPGPWLRSQGPAGSSERWVWSHGPAGSSDFSGQGR